MLILMVHIGKANFDTPEKTDDEIRYEFSEEMSLKWDQMILEGFSTKLKLAAEAVKGKTWEEAVEEAWTDLVDRVYRREADEQDMTIFVAWTNINGADDVPQTPQTPAEGQSAVINTSRQSGEESENGNRIFEVSNSTTRNLFGGNIEQEE